MKQIEMCHIENHRTVKAIELPIAQQTRLEERCREVEIEYPGILSSNLANYGLEYVDSIITPSSLASRIIRTTRALACALIIEETAEAAGQSLTPAERSALAYEYPGEFATLIDHTLRYLAERTTESGVNTVE